MGKGVVMPADGLRVITANNNGPQKAPSRLFRARFVISQSYQPVDAFCSQLFNTRPRAAVES